MTANISPYETLSPNVVAMARSRLFRQAAGYCIIRNKPECPENCLQCAPLERDLERLRAEGLITEIPVLEVQRSLATIPLAKSNDQLILHVEPGRGFGDQDYHRDDWKPFPGDPTF